jgi:hypothetical protein
MREFEVKPEIVNGNLFDVVTIDGFYECKFPQVYHNLGAHQKLGFFESSEELKEYLRLIPIAENGDLIIHNGGQILK